MPEDKQKKPVSEKLQLWRDKRKSDREHIKSFMAPEDVIIAVRPLVPWNCSAQDDVADDISPADCLQLCKALLEYVRLSPTCYSEANFLLDCTGYTQQFLMARFADKDDWIEAQIEEKDRKAIKNAYRLYRRARDLCERHLTQYHVATNPQFAWNFAKNKFGYIDKTEHKSEVSGSQKIEITFKIPDPILPPKQETPKSLENGNRPFSAPTIIDIEAKPVDEKVKD